MAETHASAWTQVITRLMRAMPRLLLDWSLESWTFEPFPNSFARNHEIYIISGREQEFGRFYTALFAISLDKT
jgi:hypothetical protein